MLSETASSSVSHQSRLPSHKEKRLHHTSYVKMGTEFAAWVLREYRRRKLDLIIRES